MPKKKTSTPTGLVHVGQLDLLAREFRPPTPAQQKLIDASAEIRENPDAIERAYLARELVQCTLPHSNPGDVFQWARRNGNLVLGITPGRDFEGDCSIGYPYGTIPRLLMFWLNTEAVWAKNKGTRRIELGDHLSEFMRKIGLNPNRGGKRSDAYRLQDQMRRLFSARISFQQIATDGARQAERRLNMEITSRSELWWSPKHPDQVSLWGGSWIELGENFFDAITAAPVPSDARAISALKRSPLALDLYVWATHKAMTARKKGEPQFAPWAGLLEQFGADYKTAKNFRQKAITALEKIKKVYPGLDLRYADRGLKVMHTSRPAIPER